MVWLENFYIKYYQSLNPRYGYNLILQDGEEYIMSEEAKKEVSHKSRKKRLLSNRYSGVGYDKINATNRKNKWTCRFTYMSKNKIRRFSTESEAAECYDKLYMKIMGENSEPLNFPEKKNEYLNCNLDQHFEDFFQDYKTTSKFWGVVKTGNYYMSKYIDKNDKVYLGSFRTEEEAAKMSDKYRYFISKNKTYKINFPDDLSDNPEEYKSIYDAVSQIKAKEKTSKYKYVQKHYESKKGIKWRYTFTYNKKKYMKTGFSDEEKCAKAADEFIYSLTGDKDLLNFPNNF